MDKKYYKRYIISINYVNPCQNKGMNIIKHFIIYGFCGLLIETLWTGFTSAIRGDKNLKCNTYLWMFFIYGLGVFFEPVHELIRPIIWVYRGLIWAALIFAVEFVTGFALERTIGSCPWDYGGTSALSIKGYIRLDFLPAWFCLGLGFEYLHDFIVWFV